VAWESAWRWIHLTVEQRRLLSGCRFPSHANGSSTSTVRRAKPKAMRFGAAWPAGNRWGRRRGPNRPPGNRASNRRRAHAVAHGIRIANLITINWTCPLFGPASLGTARQSAADRRGCRSEIAGRSRASVGRRDRWFELDGRRPDRV
jgi:hypothetical protein